MISPTKRGRVSELLAEARFIEAGFEVFTNVSPDGPADLVVWDGINFYPIDVKTVKKYVAKDGTISYHRPGNMTDGVLYLGYCLSNGLIWLSEPPEALSGVI